MLIASLFYSVSWLPYGARAVLGFLISALLVFVVVKLVLLIKDLLFRWL